MRQGGCRERMSGSQSRGFMQNTRRSRKCGETQGGHEAVARRRQTPTTDEFPTLCGSQVNPYAGNSQRMPSRTKHTFTHYTALRSQSRHLHRPGTARGWLRTGAQTLTREHHTRPHAVIVRCIRRSMMEMSALPRHGKGQGPMWGNSRTARTAKLRRGSAGCLGAMNAVA